VDVGVKCGDGGSAEVLVVDQEDVVVRVPAVLIALGELQGDDVSGDAELALQPLPGRTGRDVLPRRPFGIDQAREPIGHVVGDGDRDQARRVTLSFPGVESLAEFDGAPVVDLSRADGAQPDVAAGLQPAVVRGAILHADLDLITDRDGAAPALTLGSVRVGSRQSPQVHPCAPAPSTGIVTGHQEVVRNFASIPRQCVRRSDRNSGRRDG
jgi:hypothetical protein